MSQVFLFNLWVRPVLRGVLMAAVVLGLFAGSPAFGAALSVPLPPAGGNDVWRTYTNADYINDLALDGTTLWAGTQGGLVKWDLATGGYTKILPSVGGLAGVSVTAIVVDADGNKWFATNNGLNKFDGSAWTTYTTSSGLANNSIRDMAMDGSGNLWLATASGVSQFDGLNWTTYRQNNSGLVNNDVTALAIDGSNKWFGTYGSGLSKFDGSSWSTVVIGSGDFILNMINDIAVAPLNSLWVASGNTMGASGGGGGGLSFYNGATWTTYNLNNSGLPSPYLFAAAVDGDGTVWAGSEGGASHFAGSTWTNYTSANGLVDNWVTSVLVDGSTLWFGTNGGGISHFDRSQWSAYQTKDGLPHNTIFSMGVNQDDLWLSGGSLYVISARSSGAAKFDGKTWTFFPYNANSGLSTPEVNAMAAGANGTMWFGGWWNRIFSFNGASWTRYTDPNNSGGKVNALASDGSEIWIAVYQPFGNPALSWVSKFNGSTWTAYTTANSGLISNSVNAIAVDGSHVKWFGTPSGVSALNGTSWTSYTTADGLVNNQVNSIAIDKAGNAWFGTNGGASRLNGSIWTNYTSADGLADNHVRSIAVDPYGILWFGTDAGLSSFDGAHWKTYNSSNSGLLSSRVLGVVISASGHKWLRLDSGVCEFYAAPSLQINYSSGAPGSYFNLSGAGFPPNQTATISVNGHILGTALVDADGAFSFTLSTLAAEEGIYRVTASVNPSAQARFVLDAGSPLRAQEGALTPLAVPAGTAYHAEIFLPMARK